MMRHPAPEIGPALAAHPHVGLAIVYGSVAAQTATAESDLDLGVMGARPLTPSQRTALIADLALHSGRPVDLVDLRTTHGTLLREILRTGVRVLEQDATLYPALLHRHALDEADFQPIRDRILAERRRGWIGA